MVASAAPTIMSTNDPGDRRLTLGEMMLPWWLDWQGRQLEGVESSTSLGCWVLPLWNRPTSRLLEFIKP